MTELSDRALHDLLLQDAERGWRAFIDQYTPALIAFIKRTHVVDADEILDLYVRVCEHLGARDGARLRQHDPAQGSLLAWLAVVVRNVAMDWVRSRAGRRRVFAAVKALPALDQEVFEMYYWEERAASEIAEILRARYRRPVGLAEVLDALARVQATLSQRQRAELVSLAQRSRRARGAQSVDGAPAPEPPDTRPDPELALRRKEAERVFADALARLTPEEAAIVRLKFVQGLTHREIQRALRLDRLTDDRVKGIMARLRGLLSGEAGVSTDASLPGLDLLEGSSQ